jgi:hypothetical protein
MTRHKLTVYFTAVLGAKVTSVLLTAVINLQYRKFSQIFGKEKMTSMVWGPRKKLFVKKPEVVNLVS